MGAAAIFSHSMSAAKSMIGSQAASPLNQANASADTTSSSSSDSATISANDFLSLLVTEMQNQDPTADTDPNEYVNQLVSVNSLEQLIDINQNLSTALGSPTTSAGSGAGVQSTADASGVTPAGALASSASGTVHESGSQALTTSAASAIESPASTQDSLSAVHRANGNLSVPEASAASQRVAHSLDGRTSTHPLAVSHSIAQSSL